MDSSRQKGRRLSGDLRLYQDQFIADRWLAEHGWPLEILNDAENGDGDSDKYPDAQNKKTFNEWHTTNQIDGGTSFFALNHRNSWNMIATRHVEFNTGFMFVKCYM